jgi:hypothetical protein
MLFGIAVALFSMAAYAATPASGGAPVTVQNVPLPVSIVDIPQDMDQRRPIDVQLVGNNASVGLGQVRLPGPFGTLNCEATVEQGFVDCTPSTPAPLGGPLFVRMVSFSPSAYSAYPNVDFAALQCGASVYISQNAGSSFTRVFHTNWTPQTLASTHVLLPSPIFLPPGTQVSAMLRVWANNGPSQGGCRTQVKLWSTQ